MDDQSIAKPLSTEDHANTKRRPEYIHAPNGIQTHDSSIRAVEQYTQPL
jgi:hypothetical protein